MNRFSITRFTKTGSQLSTISIREPKYGGRSQGLQFDNTKILADAKSKWELVRALTILKLCRNERLIANSPALLKWSRKVLGSTIWRLWLKPTLYAQFVGGANKEELKNSVRHFVRAGVLPMIMVSIEEPVDLDLSSKNIQTLYEENLSVLQQCVSQTVELTPKKCRRQMQVKLTALVPTRVLQELNKIWLKETNGCPNTIPIHLIQKLEKALNNNGEMISPTLAMPDPSLEERFRCGLSLLRKLFDHAQALNVRMLVDAEYESINCALAALAYAAAFRFNSTNDALIWNTFQCYLKRTPDAFEAAYEFHKDAGLAFGVKLVRGAYLVHENQLAKSKGRSSPVNESYEATNQCYDRMAERLISLAANAIGVEGIIASHNLNSILNAAELIDDYGLRDEIVFGQVYGMADHLTYPLSAQGYHIYKSTPYGSIDDTLPYLARRIQENNFVLKGTRGELDVLKKAIFLWEGNV